MQNATGGKAINNSTILIEMFRTTLMAMIVADLAEIIAAIVDGMLTGRYLGVTSMAAYDLASPFFSIVGVVSAVLSSGAMTIASHKIGTGDIDDAKQIFSLTVFLGMAISITLAVLGLIFRTPFAYALGARGELVPEVEGYLAGLVIGIPAIVLGNVLTVFLQLEGRLAHANAGVFATVVVNLCGDSFNIFFLKGNMLGMGIATSLSYYAALVVLLLRFLDKDAMFRFSLREIGWQHMKTLISKGMPKATRRVCNILRPIAINYMIILIGGVIAMSAYSVQKSAGDFLELLGTCNGDVIVLLCGIFWGEENERALKDTVRIGYKVVFIGTTICMVLCFLFAPVIASFYLGDKPEAVSEAALCLRIYAFKLPLLGFNEMYLNYFQAIGDMKKSHMLSILHRLVYIVSCAFILGNLFGLIGIWMAFPVSELLLSLTIIGMAVKQGGSFPVDFRAMLFLPEAFGANPDDIFEDTVEDIDDAVRVSRRAEEFCILRGIAASESMHVAHCIEELAINSVQHGFKNGKERLEVNLVIKDKKVTLRLRDNAEVFDPVKWAKMSDPDDPCAHIGLRMTIRIAKDVRYVNTMKTNQVIITI